MTDLGAQYHEIRRRVTDLVGRLDADDLVAPVPACPAWTVHDLVAHMSGTPEELAEGRFPTGEVQEWLDGIVTARASTPVDELLSRWAATEGRIESLVSGSGGRLLADVAAHEHDLRGAVGRPGARDNAQLPTVLQVELDLLAPGMVDAGLGALVVDDGTRRWRSHDAPIGCTLQVDAWEGSRIAESRRTAAEVLAAPSTGEVAPYLEVLADHSPLPQTSLGERDRV